MYLVSDGGGSQIYRFQILRLVFFLYYCLIEVFLVVLGFGGEGFFSLGSLEGVGFLCFQIGLYISVTVQILLFLISTWREVLKFLDVFF